MPDELLQCILFIAFPLCIALFCVLGLALVRILRELRSIEEDKELARQRAEERHYGTFGENYDGAADQRIPISRPSFSRPLKPQGKARVVAVKKVVPIKVPQKRRYANPEYDESALDFLSMAREERRCGVLESSPRTLEGSVSSDEEMERLSTTSSMVVQVPVRERVMKNGKPEVKGNGESGDVVFEMDA